MKIKIAAFGHEHSLPKIERLAQELEHIEITPFMYKKEDKIIDLIEKAFMCDVYLFTDAISYRFAEQRIKRKRLPSILVPHDEHMILVNLFKQSTSRLSIDVDHSEVVTNVLEELNMDLNEVHVYDYGLDSEPSIDKIIEHHSNLWSQGKIDHVFTTVASIKHKLQELDIPVTLMTLPAINITNALKQAKSIMKFDLNTGAQVVTGLIELKIQNALEKKKLEESSKRLHDILEKFSKKTDISLYQVNPQEFVVFGTKPFITHLKNHYRDFPLLKEIKDKLEVPVNIGYGLGLTAKQSSINARIALEKASQSDESKCFIVNERQETIGPIGVKKEFDTSKLYHALIHKARLNNELSYNFIEFIQSRNNEPFSSHDIANFYNVTKRSAERTVNKLLNGEVIRVSGEERPYQKGRPRKLFTLNQ